MFIKGILQLSYINRKKWFSFSVFSIPKRNEGFMSLGELYREQQAFAENGRATYAQSYCP